MLGEEGLLTGGLVKVAIEGNWVGLTPLVCEGEAELSLASQMRDGWLDMVDSQKKSTLCSTH